MVIIGCSVLTCCASRCGAGAACCAQSPPARAPQSRPARPAREWGDRKVRPGKQLLAACAPCTGRHLQREKAPTWVQKSRPIDCVGAGGCHAACHCSSRLRSFPCSFAVHLWVDPEGQLNLHDHIILGFCSTTVKGRHLVELGNSTVHRMKRVWCCRAHRAGAGRRHPVRPRGMACGKLGAPTVP